jgi:hypothetical protein
MRLEDPRDLPGARAAGRRGPRGRRPARLARARPTWTDWCTRLAVVVKKFRARRIRAGGTGKYFVGEQSIGGRIPAGCQRGTGNAEKSRSGRAARRIHLHCRSDAAGCRCAASDGGKDVHLKVRGAS